MNTTSPHGPASCRAARMLPLLVQAALVMLFASGCGGFYFDLNTRDDLGAAPDPARATGIAQDFVRFAQVTDVHIVDDANPIRFENLPAGTSTRGDLDSRIQSISRYQDQYSARIWDAVIRSINAANAIETIDMTMFTGDATDTGIKTELRWFIEIADGVKSESLQDAIDAGTMADVTPAGLDTPWYAVVGNHDVEYQGTLNSVLLTKALLSGAGDPDNLADLCRLPDVLDLYADSLSGPYWHGFDHQPPVSLDNAYGYYSFNVGDYVHFIVLNTAIYQAAFRFPVETFAAGVLDRVQFNWMKREIESNSDRICVVFSHHGALDSFKDSKSMVSSKELRAALCSYENVVAHVNGHNHVNRIRPIVTAGRPGGYWDINTCSVIEWPQEWRDIAIRDNGDGTGSIACAMVQHGDAEALAVAEEDPDAQKTEREGEATDRNVALLFRFPLAVRDRIVGP